MSIRDTCVIAEMLRLVGPRLSSMRRSALAGSSGAGADSDTNCVATGLAYAAVSRPSAMRLHRCRRFALSPCSSAMRATDALPA